MREYYHVDHIGFLWDAVAAIDSEEHEWACRLIARIMQEPQNGVSAVCLITEHIKAQITATRRAARVRRIMLDYLAAQGLEGEHLECMRARARDAAARAYRDRESERERLENAFLRGPAAYAATVKDVEMERRAQARREARDGYRPTMGAA